MQQLPQMASVADLRHRHIEIFAKLTEGPVLIANRNRPAGVLISPEQWDTFVEELDMLRDMVAGLEALLRLERGEEETFDLTPDQLNAWVESDAVAH